MSLHKSCPRTSTSNLACTQALIQNSSLFETQQHLPMHRTSTVKFSRRAKFTAANKGNSLRLRMLLLRKLRLDASVQELR